FCFIVLLLLWLSALIPLFFDWWHALTDDTLVFFCYSHIVLFSFEVSASFALVRPLSFSSTYAMRQLVHVNPWLAALLVMFVIRLSSGCLVVTLTHSCSFLFDAVRADGAWATPVVVRVVRPTAQDVSQVYSVVWKKQWALARKKASTKIPDDSRRHCGFSWPHSNGVRTLSRCWGSGCI
ncbi:putative surface protease GP63, partial [Trypanosoma cruzi]